MIRNFASKRHRLDWRVPIQVLVGSLLGTLLLVSLLSLALVLYVTLWVGREGYFGLDPAIDTVFTVGYSEARFETIQPGMTKAEVLHRLGPPFNNPTDPSWIYSRDGACSWWDFAWLARGVNFDHTGRVVERAAIVAYD